MPFLRNLAGVPPRASFRLYAEVARGSFRRYSTYRGATFAGIFTNTVFGFLQAYVLLGVVRAGGGEVGGLDASAVVTYEFLAQGFLATVGAFGELGIGERIRTGDIVIDLYRPVDFQQYWLAQDLGRAGFQAIFRGIPPFLLGALVFDLQLPGGPGSWLAFVVSATLAVVVSYGCRFLTSLTGFWLLDARGAHQLMTSVVMFFSGFVIPVSFFPSWLADIAHVLPFVAIVQLPIELFLGLHPTGGVAGVLAIQVFWAVVLLVGGRVVLARATQRVVVQGG
ncbi:MAG: ABC-2 family transporter protein [Acidimicrobiia bacterium]